MNSKLIVLLLFLQVNECPIAKYTSMATDVRFADVGLYDTFVRLVVDGRVIGDEEEELVEGDIAVYSKGRNCAQHPTISMEEQPPRWKDMMGLFTGDRGIVRYT
jgi:hypothetical protein